MDTVLVFHNIGLDRLVNSYRNPALVDRAVTYMSCPRTQHVMDLDNITSSVLVTAGGSLTFQNLIMQVRLYCVTACCCCQFVLWHQGPG